MNLNNRAYLVAEGDLCIKGKDFKGQDIEVCAEIENLEVSVDQPYDYTFNSHTVEFQKKNTYLKMKVGGDGVYTVKALGEFRGVKRTARVLGWEDAAEVEPREPTIALIKAAAEKAGVDENTNFELIEKYDYPSDMRKVYVEFRWEE